MAELQGKLNKANTQGLNVPSQPKAQEFQDSFLDRDEPSRESLSVPVAQGRERLRSESDFDRDDISSQKEEKKVSPKKEMEDSFMDRDDDSEHRSEHPQIIIEQSDTIKEDKKTLNGIPRMSVDSFMDRDDDEEVNEKAD